jgi:hypothetical protein
VKKLKFGIIFFLAIFRIEAYGAFQEEQVYIVSKLRVDPLPSLFIGGYVKISNFSIPVTSTAYEQSPSDPKCPIFTIVGSAKDFLLYGGSRNPLFLEENHGMTYNFRSQYGSALDVSGCNIAPFSDLFKCRPNTNLSLHVELSSLYNVTINTQAKLRDLGFSQLLLAVKFEEIS